MLLDSGARYLICIAVSGRNSTRSVLRFLRSRALLGTDLTRKEGNCSMTGQLGLWKVVSSCGRQGPAMLAEIMYTSGTTGEAKGVLRTHANVQAASRNAISGFGYQGSDVIAIVMPLSHSSALNSQMIPLLQLGGTLFCWMGSKLTGSLPISGTNV